MSCGDGVNDPGVSDDGVCEQIAVPAKSQWLQESSKMQSNLYNLYFDFSDIIRKIRWSYEAKSFIKATNVHMARLRQVLSNPEPVPGRGGTHVKTHVIWER